MERLTGVEIAWAAQLACLFEVSVEKPGNVSPRVGFADARFEDFAASAVAIGPAMGDAGLAGVGETIARAAAATRRLVATNTNLGMILLLAPLAKAAARLGAGGDPRAAPHDAGGDLRAALHDVLEGLTVQDARLAYAAIRAAAPAGMGEVERHDVGEDAVTVTLRAAMDAARERDSIAREYVTDFAITFTLGAATLQRCWQDGAAFSDAVVTAFLTILAAVPDTLIARKNGLRAAEDVSRRAARVLAAGGRFSEQGRARLAELAGELGDEAHALNPGTTADLVAAALFVFLTEGEMLADVPALTARW
ncbi:MAG: triphosphoribosyl-dephospho-CoA synthase [Actinomycetes bacterium]